MRDYKGKMSKYRLSPERYQEVRNYCLEAEDDTLIRHAIDFVAGDVAPWMLKHVRSTRYVFPQMDLDGLPVSHDLFRIKRQRVYFYISMLLSQDPPQ